jgi:hypothetical protein
VGWAREITGRDSRTERILGVTGWVHLHLELVCVSPCWTVGNKRLFLGDTHSRGNTAVWRRFISFVARVNVSLQTRRVIEVAWRSDRLYPKQGLFHTWCCHIAPCCLHIVPNLEALLRRNVSTHGQPSAPLLVGGPWWVAVSVWPRKVLHNEILSLSEAECCYRSIIHGVHKAPICVTFDVLGNASMLM